jgi:hypothetical protein
MLDAGCWMLEKRSGFIEVTLIELFSFSLNRICVQHKTYKMFDHAVDHTDAKTITMHKEMSI